MVRTCQSSCHLGVSATDDHYDTPRLRRGVSWCMVVCDRSGLQVAATILFEFEGFEEGLEVALAEAWRQIILKKRLGRSCNGLVKS